MPSEYSLTEDWSGKWDMGRKRGADGEPQDPRHGVCPLPDSLQVIQRTSRMAQPTSRTEVPVMNPYTHRGTSSVVSRTALVMCRKPGLPALMPSPGAGLSGLHHAVLVICIRAALCLAPHQVQSGTAHAAPAACPLGPLQHTVGRSVGLTCNRVCYENKGK